ncbi:MAG: protein kinase [Candidatus Obscuribacterales bacterium]|nr:protein kinase [Candidatus Obscuribacterales bacterium]
MVDEVDNQKQKVCLTCNKRFGPEVDHCPDDGGPVVLPSKDSLVGQVFADNYQIIGILGEGGMSVVYKARHRYMDRIVAVKLLLEHLVADKVALARFERESRAASSLSLQNIVTVHDFGRTKQGQAYFVMDCLEGQTLGDILERDLRLPLSQAVNIFKQTCDGLDHAHKKGVIHRDLKPSNLVLIEQDDGSTLVKIVDFGIAKMLPKDGKQNQNITVTGEIFGSPLYMSPEQCNGRSMDQRSDIYSLGCLMYETLAGVPPLMGDSFVNTVVKHINDAPPPFSKTCPEAQIPSQVEACIMKCLAKDPDERYQSAAEVRQSLLDAALEAGVKGLRPGAVTEPSRRADLAKTFDRVKLSGDHQRQQLAKKKGNGVLYVGVAALLATIGIVATLLLWQGPDGDKGPNYLRYMWQWDQFWAQEALKKQNYDEAKKLLLDARKLALEFQDGHKRLLDTLYLLVDAYGKCGMYAQQESTNQEIVAVNTEIVKDELNATLQMLRNLQKGSGSTVTATMNQLEAEANAENVMLVARKLLARSLFADAERLLVRAIDTFDHLKLTNHQKSADFKILLADCLVLQQRMSEVRPLLLQALQIREQAPDLKKSQDASRKLIKAYLKLGQFDRDQSEYPEAKSELQKAQSLAESRLNPQVPDDADILRETYNSFAEYYRQQKDGAAEVKVYMDKVSKLPSKRVNLDLN